MTTIQAQEEPLDPALPIVDTCHHLIDRSGRRYLFFDFLEDLTSGHNIVATVAVEDMSMFRANGPAELRCIGETEFYNGVGAMSASGNYGPTRICAAIVGFADLRMGNSVQPVLEAHVAAGGGRFRGIRMSAAIPISSYPSPSGAKTPAAGAPPDAVRAEGRITSGMLLEPSVEQGLRCAASLGLTFDVHANHPQLPDVLALARAVPEATIVLNHCGQPLGVGPFAGRRDEVFAEWRKSVQDLATCPNVHVKLGGLRRTGALPTPAPGTNLGSVEVSNALAPYLLACIEAFGTGRCMFESNYPADRPVAGYAVLWNTYKRVTANFSAHERAALFGGTAARVYRLSGL